MDSEDRLPLESAHTIEFTTDEVTWMSVDLSPDGSTVVFDGNPLDNIENTNTVRYVMKNGELYEAVTLNQIWPQRKPLPEQYWWGDMPTPTTPTPPIVVGEIEQ